MLAWIDEDSFGWSLPTEATGLSTIHRGDLGILRNTGVYTQSPATHPAAARRCDVSGTVSNAFFQPAPGDVAFYLISAQTISGESGLGFDSDSQARLDSRPCP